jgi:hypothetical protein
MVDNYMTYLSELLFLIFKQRPELLKLSSKEVRLSEILEYPTLDAFIAVQIERKVSLLSSLSLFKLEQYLNKTYGLTMFLSDQSKTFMNTMVETRNLIVHNRGIISQRFCSRVEGFDR